MTNRSAEVDVVEVPAGARIGRKGVLRLVPEVPGGEADPIQAASTVEEVAEVRRQVALPVAHGEDLRRGRPLPDVQRSGLLKAANPRRGTNPREMTADVGLRKTSGKSTHILAHPHSDGINVQFRFPLSPPLDPDWRPLGGVATNNDEMTMGTWSGAESIAQQGDDSLLTPPDDEDVDEANAAAAGAGGAAGGPEETAAEDSVWYQDTYGAQWN